MTATFPPRTLLESAATEFAPWIREKGEVVGRRLRDGQPLTQKPALQMWIDPFVVGVRRGLAPPAVSGVVYDQVKATTARILSTVFKVVKWTLMGVSLAVLGLGFLLGRASKRRYAR